MLDRPSITNDNLIGGKRDRLPPELTVPRIPGLKGHESLAFLDQLPGYLCVVDAAEHDVSFINDGLRRLLGASFIGSPFGATPMAGWPGLREAVEQAFATAEPVHVLRVAVTSPQSARDEHFIDIVVQPIRCGDQVESVAVQGTDVTARVQSQELLRASHESVESILDVLGDGFVAFDEDCRVIRINAAALKYDGRTEKEIVGKTHWEAWPTSAGSFLEDEYRKCLTEQVQISIERRYLGFGKDRWLELRLCPVPGGIVTFYRDVTDRKMSEAALRASEERFRALVDAIPHLVWEAGADGRLEWFNEGFAEYIGAQPGKMDRQAWRLVIHPDDRDAVVLAWRHAQQEGSIFEQELRLRRRKDGAYRWFLAKAVPIRTAAGEVIRWIGTNTDIHHAKMAAGELARRNSTLEERVEESMRDRERMWQLSADLMVVASLDGTIITTNPAWMMALDWSEVELHGRSFLDLVYPDERASIERVLAELSVGAPPCNVPIQLRHKDGSYRWMAWTAVPDEGLIHAVGRDITAEKIASDALREVEEALRQSQKMEMVGQLTGGIAHDFNNLLTGVIGSLDLLETRIGQGRASEVGRYIDTAMSSAKRAAALTHRLLAFSRRQPLDPRPVDANELVVAMNELFRRTTSESISVEFAAVEDLWLTLCDPNQLESSLLNLVINARDAMSEGGTITIESSNVETDALDLSTQRDLAPGQYVVLSVTDTGSGMPDDVIERAFEPFFTTKPIGQGTGLGLSMVYGFVKQSGGHVAISSKPGVGSTVKIYLPRYCGEMQHEQTSRMAVPEPRPVSEVVLVVEDERVVRSLVVEMLVEFGYRVLEAEDGISALSILRAGQTIDLLLTDVGLPDLNGRQLADAAREGRPDLKVLFMTGYVESKLLREGFLGHRMEVITKPFAADALATKVDHMIRG